MEIQIGDCKIRSFNSKDVAALVKYANNFNVWINLRDGFPHPYTKKDARAWIKFTGGGHESTNFAIASAEEVIGGIGFSLQPDVHRVSAEIGYWLGEPFWGKGIATRALKAMTDYAFATYDLTRIYAGIFEWNDASGRVLEKAGYKLEARLRKSIIKNGKVIDQLLYAVLRDELK